MDKVLGCILLSLLLLAAGCKGDQLGPGSWTIKNPTRYKFDYKAVGDYNLGPTLTVGSNGVMLSVQISALKSNAPSILGKDIIAKVQTPGGSLKQLDAPGSGELMTFMEIPFAIWYFAPSEKGESVSTFEVQLFGTVVEWNFKDGKKL